MNSYERYIAVYDDNERKKLDFVFLSYPIRCDFRSDV